jgi:glucose 1-dehydrogenase
MNKLQGYTALITGGSSGIGKSIVKKMADEGANVAINYHSNPEAANHIVEEINSKGGKAIAIGADVSKEDDVINMFDTVCQTFGTLDVLINNAGMQKDNNFIDMSLQEWQKVIDVNLTGQFLCARQAARVFTKQGIKQGHCSAGKIIFMSSVHDLIPWAGHVNYASSKGGVLMLMKSIAQELAPHKIRANAISPGAIKTPINEDVWKNDQSRKKLLELIPYQRIGEPEDVAKAAIWLASDESDYVNGTVLYIDGGMTTYPAFAGNG